MTSSKRVLDELWDEFPLKPEKKEIRTVLGNFFYFSGDDVLKPVSSLSGGEKARVALAKLMMQRSNFLILDEPTNHLDLNSKEILENALIGFSWHPFYLFPMTVIFINRVATKVIELSREGSEEYLGDYDYYVQKKAEMLERAQLQQEEQRQPAKVEQTAEKKRTYLEDKERKKAGATTNPED
ncbi:hypothetical protein GCM10020331_016360 [Ectobacillus funiculus]